MTYYVPPRYSFVSCVVRQQAWFHGRHSTPASGHRQDSALRRYERYLGQETESALLTCAHAGHILG